MRVRRCLLVALCLLACEGCGKTKSTDELIADLKSPQAQEKDQIARFASCRGERGMRPRSFPR